MRILITFAVPTEFAALKRRHKFSGMPGLPVGMDLKRCPMYHAHVGKTEMVVALTGIGPVRARRAARYALQCGPDLCISSGLAGALKDAYKRGDILAAVQVMEARGKRTFTCHAPLVERAGVCGARVVERFLTSPTVVLSSKAKRALGAQGDAVEMESLGVLAAASAANTPAVAIRVISDDAGQDLPVDFNHVLNGKGKVRPVRLLSSIAAEPASLRGLLQLAGDSKRASAGLAEFLDGYIADLAQRASGRTAPLEIEAVERA
jgi:adenosylhomocysteine nucleosidase